jgi:predicted ATP-dependent serine protease
VGTLAPVSGIRGRAAEISVLGEALDRVASGRHSVVLIEGEAGIGKTRLLDAALERARGRGMQMAADAGHADAGHLILTGITTPR